MTSKIPILMINGEQYVQKTLYDSMHMTAEQLPALVRKYAMSIEALKKIANLGPQEFPEFKVDHSFKLGQCLGVASAVLKELGE